MAAGWLEFARSVMSDEALEICLRDTRYRRPSDHEDTSDADSGADAGP